MNNTQKIMKQARVFAQDNLQICCREMVSLKDTGVLPDGAVRTLGEMLKPIEPYRHLALAESMVTNYALERVAEEV